MLKHHHLVRLQHLVTSKLPMDQIQKFRSSTPSNRFAVFVGFTLFLWVSIQVLVPSGNSNSAVRSTIRSNMFTPKSDKVVMSLKQFKNINERLMNYEKEQEDCGWTSDCSRQYDSGDVQMSASVERTKDITDYMDLALLTNKKVAQEQCTKGPKTSTGGFCYGSMEPGPHEVTLPYPERTIPIPKGKLRPNQHFIDSMASFLILEQVKSLSDFGAGIGLYGAPIVKDFPNLIYNGYDAAGDIEELTNGWIRYFDLTLPLNLPVTEWVISIEVGEHIPVEYEGMVVRNFHAHNCKGIILTWADLEQGGDGHVNNHSRNYLIESFKDLGYIVDHHSVDAFRGALEGGFLYNNLVILRRRKPIC